MTKRITVYPLATEKSYQQAEKNIYVFKAPLNANQQEIKKAVEEAFKVSVVKIKTLITFGKKVRVSKGKHSRPGVAFRQDVKKAYVTLKEGDKINLFEEPSQPEKAKKLEKSKETK